MAAATMADTTMASDLLMPTPKLMPDISMEDTDMVLDTEAMDTVLEVDMADTMVDMA